MPSEPRIVRVRRRAGRKSWEGTVRCDGTERTFGLGRCRTEFEARTKLHQKAAEWREALEVPGDPDWLTKQRARPLDEHAAEFIQSVKVLSSAGDQTLRKYKEHLKRLIEDIGIRKVDELRVERVMPWFMENTRGYSPKSLRHHRATAVMFSKWLWERGIVPEHRLDRLPQIRLPASAKPTDAFMIDELRRLIAATPRHRSDVYHFMACTGLRIAEAKRLQVSDVRLDELLPYVHVRAAMAKSQKAGDISLGAPGLVEVARRLVGGRDEDVALFTQFPTLRTLKKDMQGAGIPAARADGSPLSWHSFRKSAAQMIVDSGLPLRHAQAQLRHSRPEVTSTLYTKSKLASRHDQMGKLPALDEKCPPKVSHAPVDNGGFRETSVVRQTDSEHDQNPCNTNGFGQTKTPKEARVQSKQKWSRGESNPRAETAGIGASTRVVGDLILTLRRPPTACFGSSSQ